MSDFKSRLDTEKVELEDRLVKLKDFLDSDAAMAVSRNQRELMKLQASAMNTYLSILKYRIEQL
jgi:hypothetical protein